MIMGRIFKDGQGRVVIPASEDCVNCYGHLSEKQMNDLLQQVFASVKSTPLFLDAVVLKKEDSKVIHFDEKLTEVVVKKGAVISYLRNDDRIDGHFSAGVEIEAVVKNTSIKSISVGDVVNVSIEDPITLYEVATGKRVEYVPAGMHELDERAPVTGITEEELANQQPVPTR